MSPDPVTAADAGDDAKAPGWCCSTVQLPERMVRLGTHPEVYLCLRRAHLEDQQAWQIDDQGGVGLAPGSGTGRASCVLRWYAGGGTGTAFVAGRLRWLGRYLP